MKLTAVYRKVPEGYIGFVEKLPGANTQEKTLDEARANLQEAIEMTLEANRILHSSAHFSSTRKYQTKSKWNYEIFDNTQSSPNLEGKDTPFYG